MMMLNASVMNAAGAVRMRDRQPFDPDDFAIRPRAPRKDDGEPSEPPGPLDGLDDDDVGDIGSPEPPEPRAQTVSMMERHLMDLAAIHNARLGIMPTWMH
jgi:hypothetical protein